MKTPKVMFILFIGITMLVTQVGSVFAAPALQDGSITGTVTALECGTDSEGNTIILVTLEDTEGASQVVGIDLETANTLGLVTLGEGDVPDCSEEAFAAILAAAPEGGLVVEISLEDVIPVEEEAQHPVGAALSLFFEDIADYKTIMDVHGEGTGFGVIAQALWLTLINEEDTAYFLEIIKAKESGDFDYFATEDESPQNWGQLKKALLNGEKKANLGAVMSDKNNDEAEASMNTGKGQGKDKSNNGKGKGNNE